MVELIQRHHLKEDRVKNQNKNHAELPVRMTLGYAHKFTLVNVFIVIASIIYLGEASMDLGSSGVK